MARRGPLFSWVWARYRKNILVNLRSGDTVVQRVSRHVLPVFGCRRLGEISSGDIDEFLNSKSECLSIQSRAHLRQHMLSVYNYAINQVPPMFVGGNPAAASARLKVPRGPVVFMEQHEVKLVLLAIYPRWRNLFATAVYTGLRTGELFGLRREHVDFNRRLLRVVHSYDGVTKSAKPRNVPIPPELVPYLKTQLEAHTSDHVFPSLSGGMQRGNRSNLVRTLRNALKRAGILSGYRYICIRCRAERVLNRPSQEMCCSLLMRCSPIPRKLRFHHTRSTFGTWAYEVTGDPRFVQECLGHSDPRTTERYTAVRAERLVRLAENLTLG